MKIYPQISKSQLIQQFIDEDVYILRIIIPYNNIAEFIEIHGNGQYETLDELLFVEFIEYNHYFNSDETIKIFKQNITNLISSYYSIIDKEEILLLSKDHKLQLIKEYKTLYIIRDGDEDYILLTKF